MVTLFPPKPQYQPKIVLIGPRGPGCAYNFASNPNLACLAMVWKPHATVAAIIARNDSYLLVEELIDGKKVINQPAGHLEDGESLLQAVVREVQEETGWAFSPTGLLGIYRWQHPGNGITHLRTTFIGTVDHHQPDQPLDTPIIRAEWFSRDDLTALHLRSPMVLQCIDDHQRGVGYPLEVIQDVI